MGLEIIPGGIGAHVPLGGNKLSAAVDALDPELDDERIVDLTTNWLYANPLLYTLTYVLVFLRQAAIPSMAHILDRGGRGPTVTHPRRRNADTLGYFATWFRYGYSSARGQRAIDRVNAIHSRFPISQADYRYVLATQIFEPARLLTLVGARPLTSTENRARFVFWRNLGRRLGIEDIPATADELYEWMLDYELRNARYTEAGGRIASALRNDWADRLPDPLHPLGTAVVDTLVAPELRAALRIHPSSAALRLLTHSTIRGYLMLLSSRTPSPRRYTTGFVGNGGYQALPTL